MKNQQRLFLLTDEELQLLYDLPQFTDQERCHYFSLPNHILTQLKLKNYNHHKTSSKLYFILQFGYFKAKNLFFNFEYQQILADVNFIVQHYFPNDQLPIKLPTQKQQIKTKQFILNFYGFNNNTQTINQFILKTTAILTKITQNPSTICFEVIQSLKDHKMILPHYSRLQDLIGAGLQQEEKRLIILTKKNLTIKVSNSINNLFKIEQTFYNITELKLDPKYFNKKEISLEIRKLEICKEIYKFSKKLLPKTKISKKSIIYYSNLAKLYTVYKLRRMRKELAYFYLTCYINQRYEHIVNNLIKAFIYHVDRCIDNAKKYAKDNIPETKDILGTNKTPNAYLIKLFTENEVMKLPGEKIQAIAFEIMSRENILQLVAVLLNNTQIPKDLENILIWKYHKEHYHRILINIRPIFLAINFEHNNKLKSLFKAIKFLKQYLNEDQSKNNLTTNNCPIKHIPIKLLNCLIKEPDPANSDSETKSKLNIYQYEFYIYKLIRNNFKKYKISVNDSIEHKDFDVDIKKNPDWEKNKKRILKQLNNKVLLMPIDELLKNLENLLEPLIVRVNQRIANGENKHIKTYKDKEGKITWTLPYPKKGKINPELNNPFFDNLKSVNISEVFDFVNQQCNFISAFTHLKPKDAKIRNDYIGIKGVLLANATTYGTYMFSKKSNIDYQRLSRSEENHVRIETIRNAAAKIVEKIADLSIFQIYNLGDMKHGSGDGTKIKTRLRTLLSRHSSKYFGRDVGIVVLTMHLNLVPFHTETIGANQHESHYSFEMLHNNTTSIDPDIISTDTAGANNVNDFIYYVINKIHAPWYRSIVKKSRNICGFKPLKNYNDFTIKPSKVVNVKKIKKFWPKLLPILVSMLSYEVSQSIIVQKLSSHEYKSQEKEALWELNNILKSVHILKCIDDPNYIRNIRTALNRGEAYHQILNKILGIGGGELRGKTGLEVEIWNECSRLIMLIIIYYNMYILSKVYEIKVKEKDLVAIEYLKHISPAAIQHMNFGNEWEFSEEIKSIDIDSIIEILNNHLKDSINKKREK